MVKRTHQLLKERARSRVDDLQAMFSAVQSARRDGRVADMAALEGRLGCLLREWGAELAEDSSTSLQLNYEEEEEDATSKLAKLPLPIPKVEQTEDFEPKAYMNQELPKPDFVGSGSDQYTDAAAMELQHALIHYLEGTTHLEYQQFNQYREWTHRHDVVPGYNTGGQNGGDSLTHLSETAPSVFPSPPAISRPKCALWDCPRPAQGSGWYQDYCSSFHATLAFNEGTPGATPVLRPGGIDLKDGPLFSALSAKSQGKNVGIPECERAATTKSPWNAPVLDGESLREWLFFDKPRRAFDSGNRKQRSLPDYCGRGWHESRKQVMKEYGGMKRSYYMDPQPLSHYEWHLYEYEIGNCDACALYRLEFKLVHPKKSSRGRVPGDSLLDLQQQMKRLNAESLVDSKLLVNKEAGDHRAYSSGVFDRKKDVRNRAFPIFDEIGPLNDGLPYCYNVETLADYYQT